MLFCCRDVDEAIRKSQEPMYNVLMNSVVNEREHKNVQEVEVFGGDCVKKARMYKEQVDPDKISELSHKNFAPQSKRKIRWAVNLYNDWCESRIKTSNVPVEVTKANLNALSFEKHELAYSMIRFIS